MRVVVVGQPAQQFRHVVAGIQARQLAAGRAKPPQQFRLRQQVQGFRRFVEEDYSTDGQQVKSRLEGPFEPPSPLRQSPYLPKLAGKERDHEARLAELDGPDDDGGGLFGRHTAGPLSRGMST